MMVFRLGRAARINDLSGTGAKLFGGRWNSAGRPVLYTSENRSLCILEVLVNSNPTYLKGTFSLATLWLDEDLGTLSLENSDLPTNWRVYPHGYATQELGNDWLQKKTHPILKVPSAVNPLDYNLLLNPALINEKQIDILATEEFTFDQRFSELS
jgi:RES domain-containing protein